MTQNHSRAAHWFDSLRVYNQAPISACLTLEASDLDSEDRDSDPSSPESKLRDFMWVLPPQGGSVCFKSMKQQDAWQTACILCTLGKTSTLDIKNPLPILLGNLYIGCQPRKPDQFQNLALNLMPAALHSSTLGRAASSRETETLQSAKESLNEKWKGGKTKFRDIIQCFATLV